MTRAEIKAEIKSNLDSIKTLEAANLELVRKSLLLSDDKQWFKEEVESHPRQKYQRKPNYLDGKLVGRVHWVEEFKDDDTGKPFSIERSRAVRIDGEWI